MRRSFTVVLLGLLLLGFSSNYAQNRPNMNITGQVSLNLPTGDFGSSAALGFGVNGTFEYVSSSQLSFTGAIGYNHFGPKGDLPSGADYSMNAIPLLAGVRYYFSHGGISPYVSGQIGLYFLSITSSYSYSYGGFSSSGSATASESDFGFVPGIGFIYSLNQNLNLDVSAKYNIISTSGSSTSYFGVNAGVQFGI